MPVVSPGSPEDPIEHNQAGEIAGAHAEKRITDVNRRRICNDEGFAPPPTDAPPEGKGGASSLGAVAANPNISNVAALRSR
jgi:hypothetical protein